MALKRLGPPDIRIRLGRGLDTRPDPTLIPEYGEDADSPLVNVAIQSGARVRAEKGVLQKEEGTAKYGVDTDATTTGQGIAVHKHPVNPYLLLAADGDVKYDSAGDGSVCTDIATGLDATADMDFAGQSGITYIANGKDQTRRYTGGATTTVLPDLPSPEECPPMAGFSGGGPAPYASDNFIHEMDTLGSTIWSAAGSTVTLDTEIFMQGTGSVKTVTDGSAYAEGLWGDLGSGNELDLSESDYVGFWLWASDAGGWLMFKMSEDASTWLVYPVRIDEQDLGKWKFHRFDIRKVLTTSRDAMRYFRFTTNAILSARTFYVDHLMHDGGPDGEYQYAFSFYDTGTGNEGPIGRFRMVNTVVGNESAAIAPARKIVFPSRAIYLPDGADRLRIYRTMAGGTRLYKIADVTPVSNAWTYDDTKRDSALEEGDALVQWPGNCPRAKFLVPRGDRMLHVGGTFVGSRNENTTTAAAANAQVTETMLPNAFGRGAILTAEIKTRIGDAWDLTVDLQRQTKGGDWSSPTTVATKTRDDCSANDTWYRFEFSTTGNADIYFSEKYDFRLAITHIYSATLWRAWVSSGNYLAYRLLVDASSHVFMSNLNEADKVPPLGDHDAPVNEMTGGKWSINREDGQDIVGGCPHGSDHLFFKNRKAYLWTGHSMDDVDYVEVLPSLGLLARRTAIDCDGEAVWLAQDKQVYRYRAGANEETGELSMLSESIYEFLDGLAESTLDTACAMYWRRRYYLFIPEAAAGSRCVFYDFDQQAWFPGYDSKVPCIIPYEPDGTHEAPHGLVLGATYYKVVKFFEVEADEGSNITWSAKSKALDFGDPSDIHRVRAYRLLVDGTAADTISVAWFRDREASAHATYSETIPAGSGIREIDRYPVSTLRGKQLEFQVSGAHDTSTKVHEMQLWLQRR